MNCRVDEFKLLVVVLGVDVVGISGVVDIVMLFVRKV